MNEQRAIQYYNLFILAAKTNNKSFYPWESLVPELQAVWITFSDALDAALKASKTKHDSTPTKN